MDRIQLHRSRALLLALFVGLVLGAGDCADPEEEGLDERLIGEEMSDLEATLQCTEALHKAVDIVR